MTENSLESFLEPLRNYEGITRKARIGPWARRFAGAGSREGVVGPGDDAGAVQVRAGFLLMSGEGLWTPLLDDPRFAGFCAVSAGVNDMFAMGGRPLGLVTVVSEGIPDEEKRERFLSGLEDGLDHYGVPLLGGHTSPEGGSLSIAVCVAGWADRLLRGDGARQGDAVVAALDLEGEPHHPFYAWDTVSRAEGARTLSRLDALVEIAGAGLATACRDISNPGLLGTLAMLLEASDAGALVDLDAIPAPVTVDLEWWMRAYPSFGFLLTTDPALVEPLLSLLRSNGIDAAVIGEVSEGSRLTVRRGVETATFLDWRKRGVTGIF
ncbi:MAG: AIR synthase related protein [Candidatus Geothermincolia bacterium]